MRRRRSLLIVAVALISTLTGYGTSAEDAPASIHGTITATGRDVFVWQRDTLCSIAFANYDVTPELVVTDKDGVQLAALQLATLPGVVTLEGAIGEEHAEVCAVPYDVPVPKSDIFVVELDPYFKSEPIKSDDLADAGGNVDVAFEHQLDDPEPDFHLRPAGKLPGTDLYRIAGTFELVSDEGFGGDFLALPIAGCSGMGGYADIKAGAQITVSNESGSIIGVGALEPIYISTDDLNASRCVFTFTIDVPEAAFYTLEMGHRGKLTYSKTDMDTAGWHVDLSIGS